MTVTKEELIAGLRPVLDDMAVLLTDAGDAEAGDLAVELARLRAARALLSRLEAEGMEADAAARAHECIRMLRSFVRCGDDLNAADEDKINNALAAITRHIEAGGWRTMDQTARIVREAYGWTIDRDGVLHGLTAGDHGYEPTSIKFIPCDLRDIVEAAKAGFFDAAISAAPPPSAPPAGEDGR